MKIKHKCKRCAELSKEYAEWAKRYAELGKKYADGVIAKCAAYATSKRYAEWAKRYAELGKKYADKCRCGKMTLRVKEGGNDGKNKSNKHQPGSREEV